MINENIKNARKAKGLSQDEMAVELNVVRQTVSKWEKGLSVPDADVLIKIAELLDVPVTDLLGVTPEKAAAEDFADELARLNEQLAIKKQEENLSLQAEKKRGLILFLSFLAMLAAMSIKNELLSIILTGACFLAAVIILYRNLALLTSAATVDRKIGTLKLTSVFNIAVLTFTVVVIALDRAAIIRMSELDDRLLAMIITIVIILFGGFICPRLPFNRHTGLRLPWTVQDEETWNLAHKIIGYISLPLVLLYLAAALTVDNFEIISTAAVLLWIGIPGCISFIFWWKKYHGRQ